MKFITKTLIVAASILVSSTVQAAMVRCTDAKVRTNAPVIFEFGYQNSASSRILTPIVVNGEEVSVFQLAQYKVTGTDMFILLDDENNSAILHRFTAVRSGTSTYLGALESLNTSTGKLAAKAVKCSVTSL